jgi:hypothetical protein
MSKLAEKILSTKKEIKEATKEVVLHSEDNKVEIWHQVPNGYFIKPIGARAKKMLKGREYFDTRKEAEEHVEITLNESSVLAEKILSTKKEIVEASTPSGDRLVYLDNAGAGFNVQPRSASEYRKDIDNVSYFAGAEISWAGPNYRVMLIDKTNTFDKEKEASEESKLKADMLLKAVKIAADKMDKEIAAFAKKHKFEIKKV